MRSEKTLFYDEQDYQRALSTLERLSRHVLCKFALVGGTANRALFPAWAEQIQAKRFNDLDILLLPTAAEVGRPLVSTTIKTDFFVNHISPYRFDGHYMGMTDRVYHVGVDIFPRKRNVETQEINLEGKTYHVLSNEELYLSVARDIYETLTREKNPILDPKHLAFLNFLENKVDFLKINELWEQERPIIAAHEQYPFTTLEGYLAQIKKLVVERKDRIEEKVPGTQTRKYGNSPLSEAWGITIENEADFYESNRLKGQYWLNDKEK